MSEWIAVGDRLPENNDMCLICEWDDGVIGPIMWKSDGDKGVWLDLFATPEAGACYGPGAPVTHWKLSDLPKRPK